MAMWVLPITADDGPYTVDIELSGSVYRFRLIYNYRAGYWSMDVGDTDDNPIVSGVIVVADWDLLSQFTDSRLPPGHIYTVDTSGQGLSPTETDLGSRVLVVYDDGLS